MDQDSLIDKLVDSDSKKKKKDKKYVKEKIYISLPVSKNYEIEVGKVR